MRVRGYARRVLGAPVEPAEVAAGNHNVPRRVRARDANGGGHRLGAGLEKLHFVRARNDAAQPLGDFDFPHTRKRRDVSARDGVDDGSRDVRLCVAKRDGAERHRTVEILVAVDVGDATTDGLCEVRRADRIGAAVERLRTFAAGGGTGWKHTERSRPKIGILVLLGNDLAILVRRFSVL